ncbi:hypothetical protein GCM10010232_42480 [Streptomyces amakusaensis]
MCVAGGALLREEDRGRGPLVRTGEHVGDGIAGEPAVGHPLVVQGEAALAARPESYSTLTTFAAPSLWHRIAVE